MSRLGHRWVNELFSLGRRRCFPPGTATRHMALLLSSQRVAVLPADTWIHILTFLQPRRDMADAQDSSVDL